MTRCVTFGIRHTKAQVCTAPSWLVQPNSTIFEDIDGIKIRYDNEGGATKRSYNYRVRILCNGPQTCRGHSPTFSTLMVFLGRDDKRSGGNGHERTLFSRAENAGIYYHPACPF